MASKKVYSGATSLRNRRQIAYASPRMVVEFELNRAGIAKIAVDQHLKDAVHSVVVREAMPYAIRISPHGETLEYLSSWQASDGYTIIAGMRRVACKLINMSGHAAAVEWGRGSGGREGVLRRTLNHLNGIGSHGPASGPAGARKTWDPGLHPRGPRGRFVRKAAP